MKVAPAHTSSPVDLSEEQAVGSSTNSMERRAPRRQGSRGDKSRLSASVIVSIFRACDLLLLLSAGTLARAILAAIHTPDSSLSNGPLFVATLAGSGVAAGCLERADGYVLGTLSSLTKQLQLLLLPLLLGGG